MVEAIIIGVLIGVAVLILVLCIVSFVKDRKESRALKASKGEEAKEGASKKEEVKEEVKEEPEPMKVVIGAGESVVVGSEGRIPCGEYTIESADGSEEIKIRIGRYVKTYQNGTKVVLTENQKVTPVSTSIVLR